MVGCLDSQVNSRNTPPLHTVEGVESFVTRQPSRTRPSETPTAIRVESTLTPTLIPSPVSLMLTPTLSPEELRQNNVVLFETNGNCLLPCWWSIIPGETTFELAQERLEPLLDDVEIVELENDLFNMSVLISLPMGIQPPLLSHEYIVHNNIIQQIEGYSLHNERSKPTTILDTYDIPAGIWIRTGQVNSNREGFPFRLTLFYPEHSFLVIYRTSNTVSDGEVLTGCLVDDNFALPYFVSWLPNKAGSYFQMVERVLGNKDGQELLYDRSLEEATGMTIESFYETFRQPDEPLCLETPRDLWDWGANPPPPTPAR